MGPPHDSNAGYSQAKRHVDFLNKKYNEQNENSLFTALIPTNIYGMNDNFDLVKAHVVPSLIHKAHVTATSALAKGYRRATLKVSGSGKPLRQFLYSKDLAKIIYWALINYTDAEPIIVSPDEEEEVSIGQVARMISSIYERKFGIALDLEFDTKQSDGQYKKTASNLKFRSLNGDFKFMSLEDGLEEVITWFISKYPDIRK